MSQARRLSIIGSTGSIGQSALSVIEHANAQADDPVFVIDTLVAGQNTQRLAAQALAFKAERAVIADEAGLGELEARLAGSGIETAAGEAAILEAAQRPVDRVLAAVVGIAGLPSTLAAVQAGNSIALANKESMVCAGPLLRREAAAAGIDIVPTDSEHNAMFQVMERREDVTKLMLTASGGPFRNMPLSGLAKVTPKEALAHPKWDMGNKISIDSASLFNKGLELIEAAYLFDMPEDQIDVVVHPQSIIHSLVAYRDGSVLAQMGVPDMRTPIAYALTWPERRQPTPVAPLDLVALAKLDFEALDRKRFPAVDLCRAALRHGGGAPTVLNCANEVAVAAFLGGRCAFTDISRLVDGVLDRFVGGPMSNQACDHLEAILAIELEARAITGKMLVDASFRREGV
ncbi:MAG: 1-deoxy-D-xylulose-5-phosphate reductoisomerase [Pseudomonadota bacterium]